MTIGRRVSSSTMKKGGDSARLAIQKQLLERGDSTSMMKEGEDIRAPWLTPSKDYEDDGSNQWPKPYLAIQEQLVQDLENDQLNERKEEPKDAASLLDDLIEMYDSVSEVDDVFSDRLEHLIEVFSTELDCLGNPLTFDVVQDYWSSRRSKYQKLFKKHPVVPHLIHCWLKRATRSVEDYRFGTHVFFLLQCQDEHTSLDAIVREYYKHLRLVGSGNFPEFVAWYPILGRCFGKKPKIQYWLDDVKTLLDTQIATEKQLEALRGSYISIVLKMSRGESLEESVQQYKVTPSMLLKWICRAYSRDSNVPLKSIRFTYGGRILFLSSAGKMTVGELGMKHFSVINVSILDESATDTVKDKVVVSSKPKTKPKSSKSKKKKGDRKNGKKKKSASNNCYSLMSDEQKHRQLHSKALSKVFEEAERTKFFSIRQRLNAMNLECMDPKSRKAGTKSAYISPSIDNPPTSGLGGKAGKSHVFVQVGEESNLYKTSKPLSNRTNQRSSATSKAIVIDLHGLSKKAALAKLDKALPFWVDMAMTGGYPFVRTVKIVHGGGNLVLEEVVASWIRQNRQVANAPKSM